GYCAVGTLALYPGDAVPFVKERLKKAEPSPEEKRLARLIADLDSDDFATREKATAELEKLGGRARNAGRGALAVDPGPEARRRLTLLVEKLGGVEGPPPPTPEMIHGRVVEGLEGSHSIEALVFLRELAVGPADAPLTREARAALQRLTGRASPWMK